MTVAEYIHVAAMVLLYLGVLMLLLDAFAEGTGWGIGCLVFPMPFLIIFIFRRWEKAWKGVLTQAVGWILWFTAGYLGGIWTWGIGS